VAAAKSRDHLALGAALRELRTEHGWTLEELADRVKPDGMNPRYISACERGEVNISFGNLLRLVAALESTPAEVMADYERRVRRRRSRSR
jgi:transcriptional regulator with XRE-family HTH domain